MLVLFGLGVSLIAAGEFDFGPVVITHEGEQKLILFLGKAGAPRLEPGVSVRWPFSTVITYEKRLLYLNTNALPIQTEDGEFIVVDNYVIWRIADPLKFYSSFPSKNANQAVEQAQEQIDRVTRADVRAAIGQRKLDEVLTTQRSEIMAGITKQSDKSLRRYGIQVADVRINSTELPESIREKVYERMRAERERLARKSRAEGNEQGIEIRSAADRDSKILVAEAKRDAEILRGEGDAESARIYAESFSKDPEFYSFLRTLEAYRKTIGAKTTLILSPDSSFFQLLRNGDELKRLPSTE
jgi:membrane protease subunit HflC